MRYYAVAFHHAAIEQSNGWAEVWAESAPLPAASAGVTIRGPLDQDTAHAQVDMWNAAFARARENEESENQQGILAIGDLLRWEQGQLVRNGRYPACVHWTEEQLTAQGCLEQLTQYDQRTYRLIALPNQEG